MSARRSAASAPRGARWGGARRAPVRHHGGCLCGALRYEVRCALRPVIYCHCSWCLRFHGHHAAYTSAPRSGVSIRDPHRLLAWFRMPGGTARRGFCTRCGASLFWEPDPPAEGPARLCIAAGGLDPPTGLVACCHIYTTGRSDYYMLADGLAQHPRGIEAAPAAGLPPDD